MAVVKGEISGEEFEKRPLKFSKSVGNIKRYGPRSGETKLSPISPEEYQAKKKLAEEEFAVLKHQKNLLEFEAELNGTP